MVRTILRLPLPARGERVGVRGPLRWARTCGGVCNAVASSAPLRIAERPPHPRPPAQVGGSSTSPRAAGRGGKPPSFSRCAFASESPHATVRKPFHICRPPKRREAGAARRAPGFRPRRRRTKACQRGRRAPSLLPALARDESGGALALRRPPRSCAEGFDPPTRPRAALPGITGCKREDPPRRQCSEHLALRSRAGGFDAQGRPELQCIAALPGTAPAPSPEYPREGVPSRAE